MGRVSALTLNPSSGMGSRLGHGLRKDDRVLPGLWLPAPSRPDRSGGLDCEFFPPPATQSPGAGDRFKSRNGKAN